MRRRPVHSRPPKGSFSGSRPARLPRDTASSTAATVAALLAGQDLGGRLVGASSSLLVRPGQGRLSKVFAT